MESVTLVSGGWTAVWQGALASLIAGSATGLGALPAFALRALDPRTEDTLLSFAGGIMLAATAFSLLLPGLDAATARTGSPLAGATVVAAGMLLGAAALWAVHGVLPHEHFIKGAENVGDRTVGRLWLVIFAIGLHNFPEGLAVGVGVGGDRSIGGTAGEAITLGIAIQNMPEGLVVALALLRLGYGRLAAVSVALLTGLVEPVGGLFGALAVAFAEALLPWGLSFAAGAMLFVISGEIVPETHRRGFETSATFGLMIGFVTMMVVSQSFT